ncbi:hypothetical protein GGR22_001817 [Flavobacterium gossypii]|uniref:Uncharacterized protein n=2 Tax=Flavobacterium TaxID=237 RepID=A0A495ML86_9FLAO|nr:hypothetical protein [Flavobacterium gossypii]RKS26716.1 hypothetical protein CLV94_1783 [Flavobacterium endophyticum]
MLLVYLKCYWSITGFFSLMMSAPLSNQMIKRINNKKLHHEND